MKDKKKACEGREEEQGGLCDCLKKMGNKIEGE